MTDFEHDLSVSLEWENTKFGVDTAATANNLTKLGYQKIVWHDTKKELPELNKYVLSYDYYNQTYVVVSWDGIDWSDNIGVYYNVDYWTELPEIKFGIVIS